MKVLIVGCGNMGTSHAKAYRSMPGITICGLVSRGQSKEKLNDALGGGCALFDNFYEAFQETNPDLVCISTYPETHYEYSKFALEKGCHVFLEKPIATNVEDAERLVAIAEKQGRKLVIGYILRHHPSWQKFIEVAQTMGKPLVMRMNLNQQSQGYMWDVHRNLMKSLSPIVDCGVHYVDVMCQMVRSKPVSVSAIGANLTSEIPHDNYNYGQLQIRYEDGSVGWYEAGWGPMISDTAYFVKDVFGPKGSVSIVANHALENSKSDNIDSHTKTESLKVHYAQVDENNNFLKPDKWINLSDEPDHQELCNRQQRFFIQSIIENRDLSQHLRDAVSSLKIVLACDASVKSGEVVKL